jgi:hypothetical protein
MKSAVFDGFLQAEIQFAAIWKLQNWLHTAKAPPEGGAF